MICKDMEFNSQICTTEEQSKRLLDLGLKKETADMGIVKSTNEIYVGCPTDYSFENGLHIPAWSLHRLLCLTNPYLSINPYGNIEIGGKSFCDIYEGLISTMEYNIKEGYFNKEYLEE